jgi:hypothetical protein
MTVAVVRVRTLHRCDHVTSCVASASLGTYNFGEDAIEGCESWNDRVDDYITNVTERYRTLSQMVNHL